MESITLDYAQKERVLEWVVKNLTNGNHELTWFQKPVAVTDITYILALIWLDTSCIRIYLISFKVTW